MIPLTQRDRLTHKASWHDPATAEGRKINTEHAALLAKDYQATKDRLIADAIRCKLGNLPPPDILQDRLEFRCQKGEMIEGRQLFWLVLDGDAIAIMTEPETKQVGHFFLLTWLFKSLVTQWEKN